jgi:hypothetical protein
MSLRSALETADEIQYDIHLTGITQETVKAISKDQNEPKWMLDFRLNSLKTFFQKDLPTW